MKTTRWIRGAALLSTFFALTGCGAGTYQIPNVEPVVKQKPEEDELEAELSGDDSAPKSGSSDAKPAEPKPAEKAPEAKPPEPKPEAPAEKPEPAKAEVKGAKPDPKAGGKPTGKR